MKITDLLEEKSIRLNVAASSKKEALNQIINLINQTGNITNKEEYKEIVFKREEQGTTGIGEGIAIPHGKSSKVKKATLAAIVFPNGVDFKSLDNKKVNLMFLIAAPETKDNIHLEVLSRLSALLMDETFREKLRRAKSPKEFLNYIDEAEMAKYGEEKTVDQMMADTAKNEIQNTDEYGYEILGITACPTGIAHTYMAAEALEKAGQETNHKIKVETQGQSGVKNQLTRDEIKNAKAIIVAADTNVDLSRFNGKKLIKTRVADGIHKPKELIKKALSNDALVYYSSEGEKNADFNKDEKMGFGHNIYRHLMSGVTHMLPFVVGGGILIAISFLLDNYEINPTGFGSNTPLAAFFNTIGNSAFGFMLTILAGYIALSIADRPGLAAGFVGGAVALSGVTIQSLQNPNVYAALFTGPPKSTDIIPPNIIPNITLFTPPILFKKLLRPVFIIPINGFINITASPVKSIPNTGYNKIVFIPSKLFGIISKTFFNKIIIYPAIKPAKRAPKNPELTVVTFEFCKLCIVTPDKATAPPTNPAAKPGLSAILNAIYPAKIVSIKPNAEFPIVLKNAASGVLLPNPDGFIS